MLRVFVLITFSSRLSPTSMSGSQVRRPCRSLTLRRCWTTELLHSTDFQWHHLKESWLRPRLGSQGRASPWTSSSGSCRPSRRRPSCSRWKASRYLCRTEADRPGLASLALLTSPPAPTWTRRPCRCRRIQPAGVSDPSPARWEETPTLQLRPESVASWEFRCQTGSSYPGIISNWRFLL